MLAFSPPHHSSIHSLGTLDFLLEGKLMPPFLIFQETKECLVLKKKNHFIFMFGPRWSKCMVQRFFLSWPQIQKKYSSLHFESQNSGLKSSWNWPTKKTFKSENLRNGNTKTTSEYSSNLLLSLVVLLLMEPIKSTSNWICNRNHELGCVLIPKESKIGEGGKHEM